MKEATKTIKEFYDSKETTLIKNIISKCPKETIKTIKYELSNPSDKIFFESDDFETAAYATILISRGRYGASPEDKNEKDVPIFLLGGGEEWIKETFKITLKKWIEKYDEPENRKNLIKVLKSFRLASGERTSANDICGRVHEYAGKLEELK